MKIAIIQPRISYFIGGGEKIPLTHSKYLAMAGIDVTIYTTKQKHQSFLYKELLQLKLNNLHIKEFEVPMKFKYLYKEATGENRDRWDTECLFFNNVIFDALRKDKPDLVLSYYILDGVTRPIELKGVLYLLGYPSDQLPLRMSLLRFFDASISISSTVRKNWAEQLDVIKENFVLSSGVENGMSKGKIQSNYKNNLVFVGRLVERKGVTTLLNSYKELSDSSDIHLWIVGDGPQREQIKGWVEVNGLKDKITLTGLVNNVSDYLKMADICVFPSYEREGLMGVVLESMLNGKAVITTTGNGNEDVIVNGINGILIPPHDTLSLTKEIKRVLFDNTLRKTLGKNAMRYADENLKWEKVTESLIHILKQI